METTPATDIENTPAETGAGKIIKCSIGFIMFEWIAGQTFKDVIGMNAVYSWIIGLTFFLQQYSIN